MYITDQARGQDGWILAKFKFFASENAKRERGQCPAILTDLAWSIKDLLYGIKNIEKRIFLLVYF